MEQKPLLTWIHDNNYLEKENYTHTCMDGSCSAIRIPNTENDKFHELYCDDLMCSHRHYMNETGEAQSFNLFFDLDIAMPHDEDNKGAWCGFSRLITNF